MRRFGPFTAHWGPFCFQPSLGQNESYVENRKCNLKEQKITFFLARPNPSLAAVGMESKAPFRHSSFGFDSSFGFRHSSFPRPVDALSPRRYNIPMSLIVVPSIDLRNGKVVRLKQGDYAQQIDYDLDPIDTARHFERAGAAWIHIVDLDGAKEGRCVQSDLIAKLIDATGLAAQVGGGVRSTEDVDRLLDSGADRVVIGTKAIEDWPWFEGLAMQEKYAGKLTLAIDAKEGMIATRAWTSTTGLSAVEIAERVSDWPLAGLLYTDVARDGMLGGPNMQHTRKLAEAGKVPVIASGGVGSIHHIVALLDLPVWGVIIGRSLHEGKVDLKTALAAARA